jgi:hypothetical protein
MKSRKIWKIFSKFAEYYVAQRNIEVTVLLKIEWINPDLIMMK